MQAVQVFGIIVRAAGLAMLVYALWNLAFGVVAVLGWPPRRTGLEYGYFLTGGIFLVLALYFLRGAPQLLRFCYPNGRRDRP
ncbi:MAG: hypothetical protein WA924_10730 [Burkholderiaceae bacterium]